MTNEFAPLKARIESALTVRLDCRSDIAPGLLDAMRYALLGGGKRLRPLFTCLVAESLGSTVETALPAACAVEMIHAYSLVHDDLPAMDNDALRHGKAATHVAFGEWTAILAGDALLTLAFETLSDMPESPPATRIACVRTLARAAGWNGMVGGQAFDMQLSEDGAGPASRMALESLHAAKTGALIRASIELGAMVSGANDGVLAQLGAFADRIGLAFQIMDDVLDATASTEVLGKPAGSDLRENKQTFVGFLGIDGARKRAGSLLDEGLAIVDGVVARPEHLRALARNAVVRSF